MRSIFLLAFAVALAAALSAQPSSTFFSTFDAERGSVVAPARDGNLWLGGQKDERVLLTKLNAEGKVLDKHSVGFEGTDLDLEHLTDLFEETDGTLVGCGNFEGDNLGRGFVFRYNPASRQTLWAHIVRSGSINYLLGITQLGTGGDYVLYANTQVQFGSDDAELLQIDRATGQIVPGKAKRIHLGSTDRFNQLVYHEGALYACGHFINGTGGFSRMRNAICKIDTATLEPVWSRIGSVPGSADARLEGRDLIVDNDALVATFSGNLTDPFWPTATVFLQKNDLAGNLLWTRQYDLPEWTGEFAEEVIALPDGYLLYGHDLVSDTSRLFLLKTDKDGNAQWARKIVYDYNDEFPDFPARSKMLRLGDALFLTALSQNNVGQTQGILVKTDLNGGISDSCAYLQTVAVFPVQMPPPVSEVVVPVVSPSTALLSTATVSVNLPYLTFSKKCGATGTCPDLPDLKATLDSIVCVDGNPLLYFTVCNIGGQPYDGSYFFYIYDKNPLTDTARLLTGTIASGDQPILPGDCYGGFPLSSDVIASMPFELDTFTKLFSLIGTTFSVQPPIPISGFPYPPNRPECSYLNNLDSISVPKLLCGDCEKPVTFVKKLGAPQRREVAFSMCAASDGNVYIAGKQGDYPMIAKITTKGEEIWVRNFPPIHPNEPIEWAQIIEDSDGMLVLCGTEGSSPSNRRAIAMRYDPAAGTVLWYKRYQSAKPTGVALVEKSPGGNFVLSSNYQTTGSGGVSAFTEYLTLNRTDGNTTGSSVGYQSLSHNIVIANTVLNNGNLYSVGSWSTKGGDEVLPFFAKISPSTFLPEWANLTVSDTASGAARWMTPTDVAFDGNIAVIAGSGYRNPFTPNEEVFMFLEKHNPDGSLQWIKRYNIPLAPEEVLTITNAYIVFGRMVGTNQFGMLKTDVNGNVLEARMLTVAPTSPISVGFIARQNLILSLPLQVLMLDHTWESDESDLVLVRTDLNFGLDDACDLIQDVQVPSQTLAAVTEQAQFGIGTNTPASAALPATAVFQADSLPLRKLCPVCAPDPDPDPCAPATFIKHIGQTSRFENMSCLRPAPNGNLYLAGRKGNNITVSMMNPDGVFLGARDIFEPTTEQIFLSEFIVDSEGMMVGCGVKGSGAGLEGFVFRYDPNGGQVKWAHRLANIRPSDCGILEKSPGGNFLLYQNANFTNLQKEAEILELDRATGQIVPAFARRYNQHWRQSYNSIVAEGNALYAIGFTDSLHVGVGFLVRRMTLTRIDAATGDVVWSKVGHTDWEQPAYLHGADLIVDANTLISLYYGNETNFTGQPSSVYLQKSTLTGDVLWVKRFEVPGKPKEIVAVPDGYIILVADIDRYLLKTDKAGNLLVVKKLINPPANPPNAEMQNQMLVLGSNLYIADYAANSATDQYTTLLKTDLNLEIGFDCSDYVSVQIPVFDVANPINLPTQQNVFAAPTTQEAVPTTLQLTDMSIRSTCPNCPDPPCTDKPDISFQIDSIGCDSAAFGTYRLCNSGKQPFVGTLQVGVYDSNPMTSVAILLDVLVLQILNLPPDSCQTGTWSNLANWKNYPKVYTFAGIVIGQITPLDPADFPFNGIAECDYANNLDSVAFQYPPAPPKPDLGPDRILCAGQALTLNAGTGFVTYNWSNGPATQAISVDSTGTYVVEATDPCGRTLRDTVTVTVLPQPIPTTLTIQFYPGDTVFLAGTPYTQPDTVTLTLTTDDGCDSVVTYILRRVITNVDLACPGNLTVPVPANQSSVNLTYPLPTATTDCPDPDIVLTLVQGLPVGGAFPVGETIVCYEAANHCGIRDTCCFTVAIQPAADETACDLKIPPGSCIKYELLSIRLDASGNPRYRMRLTNTCASPLKFAYFQLPGSMTAKSPANGAIYAAPGGNTYEVRNPNLGPYRSIRFKPLTGDLKNGESDIFEYTLPKQAQMAFVLVSAKLEDGTNSEVHINTFSCPVQPYVASVQEPATQERNAAGGSATTVLVRPNPTSGLLLVEIAGGQSGSARIQVLNAQGQLVLEGKHTSGEALQLPEGLANGLYLLLVQPADGSARAAVRFVLER